MRSDPLRRMDEVLRRTARCRLGGEGFFPSPSSGKRAFGDFRHEPGIAGEFHYVHRLGLSDPLVLRIGGSSPARRLRTDLTWTPSHLECVHRFTSFTVTERKFISRGDLVVSELFFDASSRVDVEVMLKSGLPGGLTSGILDAPFGRVLLELLCSERAAFNGVTLHLGEGRPAPMRLACALRMDGEELIGRIPTLEQHLQEFARSLDGIPELESSDSDLQRVYYYRWWLLRAHLAEPGMGRLPGRMIYEGRSMQPGWEFSRAIIGSSCLHLFDARWWGDLGVSRDIIEAYVENAGTMTAFPGYEYDLPLLPGCLRAGDAVGHYFYHLLPYHALLIHRAGGGGTGWLRRILPALRRDLEAWPRIAAGTSDECLPTMRYEGDSAMEFGPASHAYRKGEEFEAEGLRLEIGPRPGLAHDGLRWGPPRPNKRTEVATFYALNMGALAELYRAVGDFNRAEDYSISASRIRTAIRASMWSPLDAFFLELDASGRKIHGIKQVGGIFALMVVDPPDIDKYLRVLSSPSAFGLPAGLPSASADSFGFAPNNSVGDVRPHSCLWNGPVWPYAQSYGLMGLGELYKRTNESATREAIGAIFADQFSKYQRLHFLFGDKKDIRLVEHYDAMTGAPLSDQEDYNHSSFVDLVVRMICGFNPDGGGDPVLDPMPGGPEYVRMSGLRYAGYEYAAILEGNRATLMKDGRVVKEVSRRWKEQSPSS